MPKRIEMEFWNKYLALSNEQEECFILEYLFQLTIVFRSINDESSVCKSNSLALINEINHRLLNRLKSIRGQLSCHTKESTYQLVYNHMSNAPTIEYLFKYAAEKAFDKTGV